MSCLDPVRVSTIYCKSRSILPAVRRWEDFLFSNNAILPMMGERSQNLCQPRVMAYFQRQD